MGLWVKYYQGITMSRIIELPFSPDGLLFLFFVFSKVGDGISLTDTGPPPNFSTNEKTDSSNKIHPHSRSSILVVSHPKTDFCKTQNCIPMKNHHGPRIRKSRCSKQDWLSHDFGLLKEPRHSENFFCGKCANLCLVS